MKETWHTRKVITCAGEYPTYGRISFEGKYYEPTTTYGFIRPGMKVEVRVQTGVGRIAVRRVNSNGTRGAEELWMSDLELKPVPYTIGCAAALDDRECMPGQIGRCKIVAPSSKGSDWVIVEWEGDNCNRPGDASAIELKRLRMV